MKSLSKSFRYNYANIWMSILKQDIKKLEILTKNFDVGEYFGLFACIITGRSWDAINFGIDKVNYTNAEVNFYSKSWKILFGKLNKKIMFLKGELIKSEASKYLREISIVLNRIPREMLLLLKTNDLLRGIETSLGTRNSSSSFIYMSKCCVKLVSSLEREMLNKKILEEASNGNKKSEKNLTFFEILKFNIASYFRENIDLFKIFCYELFLYLFNK